MHHGKGEIHTLSWFIIYHVISYLTNASLSYSLSYSTGQRRRRGGEFTMESRTVTFDSINVPRNGWGSSILCAYYFTISYPTNTSPSYSLSYSIGRCRQREERRYYDGIADGRQRQLNGPQIRWGASIYLDLSFYHFIPYLTNASSPYSISCSIDRRRRREGGWGYNGIADGWQY